MADAKNPRRFVSMMKTGIDELAAAIKVTSNVPTKYDQILQDILKQSIRILELNPNMQAGDFEVFMNVWDCGGQPIFLSILPAFLTSKSLILLMFDARKGLHDRCIALSHHRNSVTTQHVEEVTTIQFLLQWMSCIDATLSAKSDEGRHYPQILPVGTHGDHADVKPNKEKIMEQLYEEYMNKACAKLVPEKGTIVDNTTAGKGKDEDVASLQARSFDSIQMLFSPECDCLCKFRAGKPEAAGVCAPNLAHRPQSILVTKLGSSFL